ncbi:MAG: hypothetical protein FWC92_08670 [Defluviitaleaceae bacterium]|nr:hypothetical protein [Defluviitaleaceae bacterium]
MKITTSYHRSFDILCFLHSITEDELSASELKGEYDKFYPLLSDEIKSEAKQLAAKPERLLFWPLVNLLISSLANHDKRDLVQMLRSHDEIRNGIAQSPYFKGESQKDLTLHFKSFEDIIIPFLKELEDIGFTKYWDETVKPILEQRCITLNRYLENFNIASEVNKLMPFNDLDINMWVCAFARPYGAKLCGYNMIGDYTWPDETILSTITHEMFHPPYDHDTVSDAVNTLGAMPWVVCAYENQTPGSEYKPMSGFIEENVVEALGIYILSKMIHDYDAHKYFKEHDGGSHVISPHLYDYLHSNPKNGGQSLDAYFIGFVDMLLSKENEV